MEAACSSETLLLPTNPHDIITQKAVTFIIKAIRISAVTNDWLKILNKISIE
jgi:hypothetical protein